MQVLTSTMSEKMGYWYDEFVEEFGFGPCGAFAALKRQQGWGKVAHCVADYTFGHYVIVQDNAIIDMTNPFDHELVYDEVELLEDSEMPELVDAAALQWLRTRGV